MLSHLQYHVCSGHQAQAGKVVTLMRTADIHPAGTCAQVAQWQYGTNHMPLHRHAFVHSSATVYDIYSIYYSCLICIVLRLGIRSK